PYSTQGLAAVAIILAIMAAFAFIPARDPSKVIPGIACSVISETAISAVLGAPVRLSPTTGSVCRYVATEGDEARSVFVIAHPEVTPYPRTAYQIEVVEPSVQLASNERHRLLTLIPGHLAER
ncbi:MAG: hypothetical protein ACREML_04595, partial [Vulcanimicrobiaceae bacterium]